MRAVRAIREVLDKRVSGAEKPLVAFAMVREMRDNKRDICGKSREGVTAAILMAVHVWGQENREGVQILDVSRNLGGLHRAADPAGRRQVEVRGVQGRETAQASGVPSEGRQKEAGKGT